MVETEFVYVDFDTFLKFMKDEFHGKYRFLDVGLNEFYAYALGGPQRLAYREIFNDGKNDMRDKIELLKKQGFAEGYIKTIG